MSSQEIIHVNTEDQESVIKAVCWSCRRGEGGGEAELLQSKARNTHYHYLFAIQTWQEVVVAYFKTLCLQSPNELRKITINRSQGDRHVGGKPNFRGCVASSTSVFLNRRAAARYRALASIIPGRERFSWN